MPNLIIRVTADFICPWCWIGHRHLRAALAATPLAGMPHLQYLPFELNPDMPVEGMDRRAYRTLKFGTWARSQAMDADVAARGRQAGLTFGFELMAVTPNTRLAHRLMAFAQAFGDATRACRLFEAICAAYFAHGQDIGRREVLTALAADGGFDAVAVRAFLAGRDGEDDVIAAERDAARSGIRAVPMVRIGDRHINGAQPAQVFVDALSAAGIANA